MSKIMALDGNEAIAHGVMLSKTQLVAAYPITPQTNEYHPTQMCSFLQRHKFPFHLILVILFQYMKPIIIPPNLKSGHILIIVHDHLFFNPIFY